MNFNRWTKRTCEWYWLMDANRNLLGSCQPAIYIIKTEYEPFQKIMYKSITAFFLFCFSLEEIYYKTLGLLTAHCTHLLILHFKFMGWFWCWIITLDFFVSVILKPVNKRLHNTNFFNIKPSVSRPKFCLILPFSFKINTDLVIQAEKNKKQS